MLLSLNVVSIRRTNASSNVRNAMNARNVLYAANETDKSVSSVSYVRCAVCDAYAA